METYEFDDPEKFREFMETPKRRNKYNAKKVTADGYTFDSMAEHRRYLYLKSEQEAGRISDLTVHPQFEVAKGYIKNDGAPVKPVMYIADFGYFIDVEGLKYDVTVIEDVKGGKATQTALFKLKWHLLNLRFQGNERFILRIIES
jgi:hypothetical protein